MTLVEEVKNEAEAALNRLRPLFVEGSELTFVMRVPGHPGCYMVISNDNIGELADLLHEHKAEW